MAKTCMIKKEERRQKLTKQYKAKRAKLKAIIMDKDTSMEDRFTAVMKMAKLPRNSSAVRPAQPLRTDRASAWCLSQIQALPY